MESLRTLPLEVLRRRCAEQSTRFFRREPYNPRYCFEIFRRAIVERNEEAWEHIYHQYRPLVDYWFRRHPLGEALMMERDTLVLQVFERFWQAISPQKFDTFNGLAPILRYLQLCVHTTITDAMRYRQRNNLLLEDSELVLRQRAQDGETSNPEHLLMCREQSALIWQWVERHCKGGREILLMRESLVLGFSPKEVHTRHPELFPEVNEIYRIKENILARLRRSTDIPRHLEVTE